MNPFTRRERSPTPLRTNYDFVLRHERAKQFHRIVGQCDAHAAKTSQAVRDLVGAFSQVSQSYYEVALCVNNVNPSTASILQATRAPARATTNEEDGENEYSRVTAARGGGGGHTGKVNACNTEKNKAPFVARSGREADIGYQDGVVATYGAGLQTAAKVFASETRALKEGDVFAEYSLGVHRGVLCKLKEVDTKAKEAVNVGNDTAKLLKAYMRARKLVTLKEKKYERLEKPLSQSKKYDKQVAAMQAAEQAYKARLATFDEKYEHLFQRELYVTGHTLDSLLDVNFTFMAHLMQVVGSVAPNAAETMATVVVDGGEALGKRMGIAEDERIGSKVRPCRTAQGGADDAKVNHTPARTKAEAKSSHNFTNYFSTRRPTAARDAKSKVGGAASKTGGKAQDRDSVVDVDEAPPTAKNNDTISEPHRKEVRTNTAESREVKKKDDERKRVTPPPPPSAPATAKPTPVKKPERAFAVTDDEPEPRRPPPPLAAEKKDKNADKDMRTPEREKSNAPYGDTPSVVHRAEQARCQPADNKRTNNNNNAAAAAARAAPPLIVKRNPSLSPSCEPYGYADPREEVRAASVANTACSRVKDRLEQEPNATPPPPPHNNNNNKAYGADVPEAEQVGKGQPHNVSRCVFPPPAAAAAAATASPRPRPVTVTAKPAPTRDANATARPTTAATTSASPQVAASPKAAMAQPARRGTTTNAGGHKPAQHHANPNDTSNNVPNGARADAVQQQVKSATTNEKHNSTVYLHNNIRKRPVALRTPAAAVPTPAVPDVATLTPVALAAPIASAPPADDSDSDATLSQLSSPARAFTTMTHDSDHHGGSDNDNNNRMPQAGRACLSDSDGLNMSLSVGNQSGTGDAGRPTVAAAVKGLGSLSSLAGSFAGLPIAHPDGHSQHGSLADASLSAGMTPQGQYLSGASTPPPPPLVRRGSGRAADPFYTAAWEEVNLAKGRED